MHIRDEFHAFWPAGRRILAQQKARPLWRHLVAGETPQLMGQIAGARLLPLSLACLRGPPYDSSSSWAEVLAGPRSEDAPAPGLAVGACRYTECGLCLEGGHLRDRAARARVCESTRTTRGHRSFTPCAHACAFCESTLCLHLRQVLRFVTISIWRGV
jgi:hypothetical protein